MPKYSYLPANLPVHFLPFRSKSLPVAIFILYPKKTLLLTVYSRLQPFLCQIFLAFPLLSKTLPVAIFPAYNPSCLQQAQSFLSRSLSLTTYSLPCLQNVLPPYTFFCLEAFPRSFRSLHVLRTCDCVYTTYLTWPEASAIHGHLTNDGAAPHLGVIVPGAYQTHRRHLACPILSVDRRDL